jgi:hypothetical protein
LSPVTDRLAGRRVAHFLEIFEMPVSMASLALGSRAEHGDDVVVALDLGLSGEIEKAAVPCISLANAFLRFCSVSVPLREGMSPPQTWLEKPMTARIVCPPGAGSQSLRKFLICGWSRVTVDADDHVDATDDGARARLGRPDTATCSPGMSSRRPLSSKK